MVTACFDKRKHLGGKQVHQKMPVGDDPQKPCALMSRQAPSSEFEVSCDSSSPGKACNGGSIHPLGHTAVIRLAVKSLRSLWYTDGKLPVGQVCA